MSWRNAKPTIRTTQRWLSPQGEMLRGLMSICHPLTPLKLSLTTQTRQTWELSCLNWHFWTSQFSLRERAMVVGFSAVSRGVPLTLRMAQSGYQQEALLPLTPLRILCSKLTVNWHGSSPQGVALQRVAFFSRWSPLPHYEFITPE